MKARVTCGLLVAVLLFASLAVAQRRRGFGGGGYERPAEYAHLEDFDGGFQFCRLVFRQSPAGDGAGWNVDWPRADMNLSTRLAEITRTHITMDDGVPKTELINPGMVDEMAKCPFIMMTEPGTAYFTPEEAKNLREYLLRGGFLWADDFWGPDAWDFFENSLRQVLPSSSYPIVDLPRDHTIFHQVLDASTVPQIPGIGYWDGRNATNERGPSTAPNIRAINDEHGRVMVLMTHDTDFGDSYEREAENPEYFMKFSVPGYAFGINVIVYAMTH
jgi:hypothetical protein